MDADLLEKELEFIKNRTGISDIDKIKALVQSISDIEALDIIEAYRKKYFDTPEKKEKAKRDLEGLLKTEGIHSQLEKAAVHLIEKLI